MKYYINFAIDSLDTYSPENLNALPTDPMYLQDGVYNQRCKYRMTNFMLLGDSQAVKELLNNNRLGVRFNTPSYNQINYFDNAGGVLENPSLLTFPINLGGMAFQSNGSAQQTNKVEYNAIAINTFTEEYIGGNLWGQVPHIELVYQEGVSNWTRLLLADDVEVNFTLEVEPIAVRL